jgi:two-component system response regulator RegA
MQIDSEILRRSLLIVEDDESFAKALRRSFERRDYVVVSCDGIESVRKLATATLPDFAVVDLKLANSSGLECLRVLLDGNPDMKVVVLTGFASIATAVEAIKLGACHYLAKPSNADDIEAAFDRADGDVSTPVEGRPTSLKNLEWERIHETLVDSEFNISEAARRLGLHRRTLARKLNKRQMK